MQQGRKPSLSEILLLTSLILLVLSTTILLISTNELKIWNVNRKTVIEWNKVYHISGTVNYTLFEKIYNYGPRFTVRGTLAQLNETHYLIQGDMRAMLDTIEGRKTSTFVIIGRISYTNRTVSGISVLLNTLGTITGLLALAFTFITRPRQISTYYMILLSILSLIANTTLWLFITKLG